VLGRSRFRSSANRNENFVISTIPPGEHRDFTWNLATNNCFYILFPRQSVLITVSFDVMHFQALRASCKAQRSSIYIMPLPDPHVHMLYPNELFMCIVMLVKSVRLRWNGLGIWKYRPCRILLTECLAKLPLGISTWLSKYNIKIDVRREAVTMGGTWK